MGQNETGLKRLNLQIIPVIKQERGHTEDTLNKNAHTQRFNHVLRVFLVVLSGSENVSKMIQLDVVQLCNVCC